MKKLSQLNWQRKHCKCENFLSYWKMLKMLSASLHVISQPLSETRNSFVNWTCGKLSHIFSCATFNSETCWLRTKFFKKFVHRSPNMISQGDSDLERERERERERVRWPQLVLNRLRTVRMYELLSDTCTVRRAPCISLNLPLRLTAVFNKLWKQKLKRN